jgi:hypothetical protein
VFNIDKENNIYFGNYVYSSIKKELREISLLDKTACYILLLTKIIMFIIQHYLLGYFFKKIKQNRLEKLIFLGLLSIQLLLTKMIIFLLIIMKIFLFF